MKPMDERLRVELTPAELELIEVGLKMLLHAEDDPETIRAIHDLLPRLAARRADPVPEGEVAVRGF